MAQKQNKLKIIPLGGVDEIGKNMTVIEYGKDILVIDCGMTFPSEDMLGIDLVIPDITYLENNKDRIKAFLFTHGHEDHIGAVPYVLQKINAPIYATRLTNALIKVKLEDHKLKNVHLNEVNPGAKINIGCFTVEFIKVCHSIAGACAIAITTPVGIIVFTGDFKIDYTPIDGEPMDLGVFAKLGREGVLCLLSDSTNVERAGYTMSERTVGESFDRYFKQATGRVIIASFASNIHRVQQIVDAAQRYGRKVCFQGRSMIKVAGLATKLGYLNVPDNALIEVDKIDRYDDDQIVIVTTGSQGEPMSGLVRMATKEHKKVDITPGDMVIISASPIPGNEKTVSNVINQLYRKGAVVVYEAMADIHVSGHACREELKLMLALTKPKYFIPVHGEYRHLCKHADLAKSLGIDEKNIFLPGIGNTIEFTKKGGRQLGNVVSGSVLVDGSGIGDVGNIVLRDRKVLSQDGLFVVVVGICKDTGKMVAGPDIISRGFIYMRESEDMLDGAKEIVRNTINNMDKKQMGDWQSMKSAIRNTLRNHLYDITKRNPMILPIIIDINNTISEEKDERI